jgi:hypothetical protein
MKTPFDDKSPVFLMPPEEVRVLRHVIGRRVSNIVGDHIHCQLRGDDWTLKCWPDPSSHGASPQNPEAEELMRLQVSWADEPKGSHLGWKTKLEPRSAVSDVKILHSVVTFGEPQFSAKTTTRNLELGPSMGYSHIQLAPERRTSDDSEYAEVAALEVLNQVDVGIRLTFASGRSVTVSTDGCLYEVMVLEGDAEAEYLRLTESVPLDDRE